MSSADEILLAQPMAKAMLEAGVPRAEVIAGLRTAQPAAQEPDDVPLQTRSHSFCAPLPPGWEERFDPSSGRKFYVDYVNKSTSWARPTAAAPASGASAVSTEEHATPWSAIPSTGVAYPRMSARDRAETAPTRGVAALGLRWRKDFCGEFWWACTSELVGCTSEWHCATLMEPRAPMEPRSS